MTTAEVHGTGPAVPSVADDVDGALATTRDSLTVAAWTAVSRITGLVRVAVIAAVLGATYLGNSYQFTNSVPNLVYYGLLGGALVSSVLVPVLVRHLVAGETARVALVARGFLGCTAAAAAAAAPLVIVAVPLVLLITNDAGDRLAHAQTRAAVWLVVLVAPQIVGYAVVACSVAVMNAHRRFAVAAAAPTIENLGSLLVLALVWVLYGTGREVSDVGPGELVLLGAGTTAAVGLHAALQWCGARRCGVTLVPRWGWRDREVRGVVTSSAFAVAQAGLWAVQLVVALALVNRLPGAVVAVLVATNFFFLPIALAATPIALGALPRLAHLAGEGRRDEWADAVVRALSLTLFATAPAAVGYLVLAGPLGRVIGFGGGTGGRDLVALSLAGLAPGVVGTALFTVATYVSYSRDDARSPLWAMGAQALVAAPLMLGSLGVAGRYSIVVVTGGLAVGTFVGACVLLSRLDRSGLRSRLLRPIRRSVSCAALMAPVVWVTAWAIERVVARLLPALPVRVAEIFALSGAVLVGAAVYLGAQRLVRSPELALVRGSVSRRARTSLAGPEAQT